MRYAQKGEQPRREGAGRASGGGNSTSATTELNRR